MKEFIDKVEDFITRRFPKDCNWTQGNCYWFAFILSTQFKSLQIFYDPINGHFLAGNSSYGVYFDWEFTYINYKDKLLLFEELKKEDPIWAARIERDCIN